MADFRVGLIGCGGIAHMHATVLTGLKGRTQLVAFCDVAQERAEEYNQKYAAGKGAVYTDFNRMFEQEKLDIVYICLPPFAHSNEVEVAAAHGVHVFIEKPIALDMQVATRMVQAVEQSGIKSQVGFMNRFGEAVEQVKALIDSGEAGEPGWALGTYKCNSLHGPWWRDKSKSGGQVVEQIIHTYDIIRYFLGEPKAVFCFADNLFHRDVPNYTSEDVSAASLKFQNGAVATVAGTNGGIPGKWLASYSLVCRNLTVDFIDANHATIYRTDRDPVEEIKVAGDRNVGLAETLDLLNAIESNGATRTPMSEGAKTLAMVLAVTKSGESGQVVNL
jgi:predicted dehydrogenase